MDDLTPEEARAKEALRLASITRALASPLPTVRDGALEELVRQWIATAAAGRVDLAQRMLDVITDGAPEAVVGMLRPMRYGGAALMIEALPPGDRKVVDNLVRAVKRAKQARAQLVVPDGVNR